MDHDELARRLAEAGVPLSPAECHGSLCGLLTAGDPARARQWLEETLGTAAGPPPAIEGVRVDLREMAEGCVMALGDPSLASFQPLLPGDESPMGGRTDALAQWVQSFLGGLGLGEPGRLDTLSDEAREALSDLAEIAQLRREDEDDDEQEAALVEVSEYLRVVVQLLYTELQAPEPAERAGSDGGPGGETLH